MGWDIDIHAASVMFKSKELFLEFEEDAQVTSFTWSRGVNPGNISFKPTGVPASKKIEMYLDTVIAPYSTGMVLGIESTGYPCFTKITWADKNNGQSRELDQRELDIINKHRC